MTTKRCTKCGETKPTSEFSKDRKAKDGLNSSCRKCRARQCRERKAKCAVERLCNRCGIDIELGTGTKRVCENCARKLTDYRKRRAQALRADGLCVSNCGQARVTFDRCRSCWFKQVASQNKLGYQFGQEIEALFNAQGGRCTVTGVALKIKEGARTWDSASLDHIVPKSKGGTNDISNLRWVCNAVNTAKSDLSDAEFVGLCRAIATGPLAANASNDEWEVAA